MRLFEATGHATVWLEPTELTRSGAITNLRFRVTR